MSCPSFTYGILQAGHSLSGKSKPEPTEPSLKILIAYTSDIHSVVVMGLLL